MARERLDKLLVERGLAPTRAKAQALIMAGDVRVNGELARKAGQMVVLDAGITLTTPMPYVSRGGYKLAGALDTFGLDIEGAVCVDIGASTGGFTDVLLQRGASKVYAVDVGYGQLAWKLRQDRRVVIMDRTNARYLTEMPEQISVVVVDVSFISLRLILQAIKQWQTEDVTILALIKPQFEAGRKQVGKGGIVKDPFVHRQVLAEILAWCVKKSLYPAGLVQSSIAGSDGNIEFLVWLQGEADLQINIDNTIDKLVPIPVEAAEN